VNRIISITDGSLSECRRSIGWRQGAKRNTLRQVGPGKDGVG